MKEQTWDQWLRAVGWKPDALGMLTGQDARALATIARCWELYACSDDAGQKAALAAVRALLPAMQPQCRFFAKELIAKSLDWSDRERIWPLVSEGV